MTTTRNDWATEHSLNRLTSDCNQLNIRVSKLETEIQRYRKMLGFDAEGRESNSCEMLKNVVIEGGKIKSFEYKGDQYTCDIPATKV